MKVYKRMVGHVRDISKMAFNKKNGYVYSIDLKGILHYWNPFQAV